MNDIRGIFNSRIYKLKFVPPKVFFLITGIYFGPSVFVDLLLSQVVGIACMAVLQGNDYLIPKLSRTIADLDAKEKIESNIGRLTLRTS